MSEYNIVIGYQTFARELYLMPNELPATHIPFGSIRKVEGHCQLKAKDYWTLLPNYALIIKLSSLDLNIHDSYCLGPTTTALKVSLKKLICSLKSSR